MHKPCGQNSSRVGWQVNPTGFKEGGLRVRYTLPSHPCGKEGIHHEKAPFTRWSHPY